MFGGDEDFSFIDEDFLQDDFLSADTTNELVHKRSNEYGKQKCSDGVLAKSPLMHTSSLTSEEKGGSCSNKDNENKKETPSFKFISSISGCVDKFASDDSFQFDDDFPIDNFETDERDDNSSGLVSISAEYNQTQNNKEIKAYSATSSHTVKNDFRSRILQTLKDSKCLSSASHNLHSPSPLNSFNNSSVECVSRNDKKRILSEAIEVSKEDTGPPFKKPYAQYHQPKESYAINSSHSSESNNVLTDSFEWNHQTDFNSQYKTNNVPVENNSSLRLKQLTATTSPNSVPAKILKTSSPGGLVIQKRKFPGPAGILPQLGSNLVPDNQQLHEKSPATVTQDVVCSQSTACDFSRGPWQQMINDLELNHADHISPLKVFNIKWVLRRASLRGQASLRKVPFLAVLVRSLDLTHNDATVVLKDPTGEMNGTIASSVMDEYSPALQCGSVLLLQGVTVLSPVGLRATTSLREHSRHHYLNITLNTVITIYTLDESGDVITTLVGKLDKGELCKQAAAPETAGGSRAIVEEEEDEVCRDFSAENPSLFSNINESFGNFSSKLNQSATMAHIPSYKSPRGTPNITKCTSAQPQRFIQKASPVSSQIRGYLGNSGPRISLNNNSQVQNPRLPTSSIYHQPQFQQSHVTGSPVNSSHPSLNCHRFLASNNINGERLAKALPCPKPYSSQMEEKEVNKLLDGVDTDSLFGDF